MAHCDGSSLSCRRPAAYTAQARYFQVSACLIDRAEDMYIPEVEEGEVESAADRVLLVLFDAGFR